ncbi:amino acid ABC transporter permease [Labrys monachus]|uniref:Polar amino acid transport system permease protein n=1 Tax=Labrys monachus TaxID=217067 RepID=A0ABU0FK43_9HYPH|nr:amino acid ABC transporter permease [Labrys monachus]MDQ0394896.1 polar amino acid transport system permease protein [Labrys monachus]
MAALLAELPRLFTYYNIVFLLTSAGVTLALTVAGCVVGLAAGFVVAAMRRTRAAWLLPVRLVLILFAELFRRIPFIVTLFLVFFISQGAGYNLPLFVIALVAVCIIASAYLAEVFRAGFSSVPRLQIEAAEAMNFSAARILFSVIVPQAWRVVLPAAVAFMVSLVKDTALASQLGVIELTFAGKVLVTRGYSSLLVYGVVLVGYYLMSYPLGRFGAYLERRLSGRGHRPALPEPGAA